MKQWNMTKRQIKKISRIFYLRPAAGCAILRIEKGKAIEAATPQQNRLNLYTRLAVAIAVVAAISFFP